MTYRKIVFTASSNTFKPLKCINSSNNTELCSHCVFMCPVLFSGKISMSSLVSINLSILILSMGHTVQKVIPILKTQCTLHNSLCDSGLTSDFEVPSVQDNTFH